MPPLAAYLLIMHANAFTYIHNQEGGAGREGAWQPRRGQRFTHGKQNGFTFSNAKPKAKMVDNAAEEEERAESRRRNKYKT